MLTTNTILQTSPNISSWASLLEKQNSRNYFGNDSTSRVIVVGHQPTFFHPGILAKFIAASAVAKVCNAQLIHLVVDHHIGNVSELDVPKIHDGFVEVEKISIATCDDTISLCNQSPMEISKNAPKFAETLQNNEQNAALQIAAATDKLMEPYVTVHKRIAATELLQTTFGIALLEKMYSNPALCINAYNNAINAFPHCGIPFLEENELPLWYGPKNERVTTQRADLRPRALLLTLLARLGLGDLFVHGIGGASYDLVMEHWCRNWLDVALCPQVMATATLKLPCNITTIADARNMYFSGESTKKQAFLHSIRSLPRSSAQRRVAYIEMQRWLASCNEKPNHASILASMRVAQKRDWAFPLYAPEQLLTITTGL